MVPEVLQGCIAEEVEPVGVVISAIHAANPEHAIAGLQECGGQVLYFALPDLDLGVVEEEVACLSQLLNLHGCISVSYTAAKLRAGPKLTEHWLSQASGN